MTIQEFTQKLNTKSEQVAFTDTMAVIEANYHFTETTFTNGDTKNEAGQNSGSCKLFAFAKLQSFSVEQTLACFGDYYRKDVLGNPEGSDHQNIRNFMRCAWEGIQFDSEALTAK